MLAGLLLLAFASCKPVLSSMYGVRKPVASPAALVVQSTGWKDLPNAWLDSAYMDYATDHFGPDSQMIKNALQPIQALYFDTAGQLLSYHVNCYVGGFPNINWNKGNYFAQFPPRTRVPLPAPQTYGTLLPFLHPIRATDSLPADRSGRPLIVVFWNYQLFRQSSNLIKLVQKNAAGSGAQLIVVSTDWLYGGGNLIQ
jgi:hypothetical protein